MVIDSILWIGLGNFGLPMAMNCLSRGFKLSVPLDTGHSQIATKYIISQGANGVKLSEGWKDNQIVALCLPKASDVEAVLSNADWPGPELILDFTSGSPETSKRLFEYCHNRGTLYIDTPVSGSKEQAGNGDLTLFVGYSSDADNRVNEILTNFGSSIFYFDSPGAGNAAKLVNQIIHLGNMLVMIEGLHFAQRLGLPLTKMVHALGNASAGSKMLSRFGEKIVQRKYNPEFTLTLAHKDVCEITRISRDLSIDLPVTRITLSELESAIENGKGDLNFTVIAEGKV